MSHELPDEHPDNIRRRANLRLEAAAREAFVLYRQDAWENEGYPADIARRIATEEWARERRH